MGNITRNFTAGKMNKVVDERLIPDGEYIDAMNIRMGSTEDAEIGVIENTKGNLPLTSLSYIDGTLLSSSATCIGAFEDGANETIYWMVHDPDSSLPTGKLDLIVSYNTLTTILQYHIISTDDGDGANTTLNFNPQYLITAIDLVGGLLFFTDDYNEPRFINITRSYGIPVGNIDGFTNEAILVIKRPPIESPTVLPIVLDNEENFMETRFLCFAYRYKYGDNEYSATSQFSAPAFDSKAFNFSLDSHLNEGMVNYANGAQITINTGSNLVVGIDLLFKEANGTAIMVIEKLDKAALGISDNVDYPYTFSNSKIYTVLPTIELLRLYDNVPRYAKAQTIMGNRLMYGNYVEGYNLFDTNGALIQINYVPQLISEDIGLEFLPDNPANGDYTIDIPHNVINCIVQVDLTGIDLVEGALLSIDVTLSHESFTGPNPVPLETTQNISQTLSFFLPKTYTSVYQMATSPEFQDTVGTLSNIQPVYSSVPPVGYKSCAGTTFTDKINCEIPEMLGNLHKYESGISAGGQSITIIPTTSNSIIGLQFLAMRYVDNLITPTTNTYEYYSVTSAQATFQKIANTQSLHSNRGYAIGIVYMDEYLRATTVLTSINNTVNIPCGNSPRKNSIEVTIPPLSLAPSWATRFKFVIKPDEENYETIYSHIFFLDPLTNSAYFLLEGENARKIEQGDRLIVKADTGGPTTSCIYTTVLEKEAKASAFITVPSEIPNVNLQVPAGVYMKLNPNNFSIVKTDDSVFTYGTQSAYIDSGGGAPILSYTVNKLNTDTGLYEDVPIPAGSRINLYFDFKRLGSGDGDNACEKRLYRYQKTFISTTDYPQFKAWWDGDNVEQTLNDGYADVGGNNPLFNEYIPTLGIIDEFDPLYDFLTTNYYRFSGGGITNKLSLNISGTRSCTGVRKGKRSTVTVNIEVFRADGVLIFETEPSDALPDVWFENNVSFPINPNGDYSGVYDTEFFDCYAFGNGAESYKIRDSIIGNSFNLGNRVLSVSAQDYKEADRFADITYSGIYNDESNVNKLNEFNLGLLNFKPLEDFFGPILKLDGRETDVLVMQEDKISYVLTGKNLLSDAGAGDALTSVPEVLGTQIARAEKYGISFNPESYVKWGGSSYFTDSKRGAVISLRGNSHSNDQLNVISEMGMRTWFRDLFNTSFNTQKLGGFDPYMNEYVLVSNDIEAPQSVSCIPCGITQTFTIPAGGSINYCVNESQIIGECIVTYTPIGPVTGDFEVTANYNAVNYTNGPVQVSGALYINKDSIFVNTIDMSITSVDALTLSVNVSCVYPQTMTLVEIILTNDSDEGKSIYTQYRYTDTPYVSPVQTAYTTFISGTANPLVSRYEPNVGSVGGGGFPTVGSNIRLTSYKFGGATFDFDPLLNSFKYYRGGSLIPNTPVAITGLLALATTATPNMGGGINNYAEFILPAGGQFLYYIWDLRSSVPINLCYSAINDVNTICCAPC